MHVNIKLFGSFRKYGGGSEILLELPEQARISDVRIRLGERLKELHPEFDAQELMNESAFADETQILTEGTVLKDRSTIAVLPPVCGG